MIGKLPPGVTDGAFEAALRGFADAVGAGNVITDEAAVRRISADSLPVTPGSSRTQGSSTLGDP